MRPHGLEWHTLPARMVPGVLGEVGAPDALLPDWADRVPPTPQRCRSESPHMPACAAPTIDDGTETRAQR